MFSCITGLTMYNGTQKCFMTIYDDKKPNTDDNGNGNGRSVVTYGGYLLEHHGPDDPDDPYDPEAFSVEVKDGEGNSYYSVDMFRERCDNDLTMLVAQCLCEEPDNRPSMEKLLEFTSYWLRHYSDPANCESASDWQKDEDLGPTGATSSNLFQAPLSLRDGLERDRPNTREDLDRVSRSLSIIPALSHRIMGNPCLPPCREAAGPRRRRRNLANCPISATVVRSYSHAPDPGQMGGACTG